MKYSLAEYLALKKSLQPLTQVRILSNSMSPWIKKDEKVTISPCSIENLNPYDIIVYWNASQEILICHIYIGREDGKVITKPLAKNETDEPFPREFILGKVIKPKFGIFQRTYLKLFY